MKKWAAHTYVASFILSQIVLSIMGVWNISSLVIPAVAIGIIVFHMNKMD